MTYSVEKLGSSGNSVNSGELDYANSLFLLVGVSAETPKNRRKGVFQQNRPKADLRIRAANYTAEKAWEDFLLRLQCGPAKKEAIREKQSGTSYRS